MTSLCEHLHVSHGEGAVQIHKTVFESIDQVTFFSGMLFPNIL